MTLTDTMEHKEVQGPALCRTDAPIMSCRSFNNKQILPYSFQSYLLVIRGPMYHWYCVGERDQDYGTQCHSSCSKCMYYSKKC